MEGIVGYLILVAIIVGGILTLNDIYHDIAKNERLTLNIPITITMHTLLGIPLLSVFMIVETWKSIKRRG